MPNNSFALLIIFYSIFCFFFPFYVFMFMFCFVLQRYELWSERQDNFLLL